MKKILQSIIIGWLIAFFSAIPAFAATYYGVKGNSNWNSGNWSTTATKDATRTGSGVTPLATDTCILDDWTSDGGGVVWTINSAAVCGVTTFTGYAGELAFGAQRLSVSGDTTFASGMTISSTGTAGTLRTNAALTLNMAGKTFPGSMELYANTTTTLSSALNVTGTLLVSGGSATAFAGAYDISVGILSFGGQYTLVVPSDQTLTVVSGINIAANSFGTANLALKSGTASSHFHLIYQGTADNCKIAGLSAIDVDASESAQPINIWLGSVTRCTNVYTRTSADIGGGGGAWAY
jgi:hypothetical protein